MTFMVILAVVAVFLGYTAYKKYIESRPYDGIKAGVLFSFYTKGYMLFNADHGMVDDRYYDVFITMQGGPFFGEPLAPVAGTVMYKVELPFNTQGHLVGISNKNHPSLQASKDYIKSNGLDEVVLEGDFPNYFTLFAPADQGVHARYIFDPAAMEFVVDFCANHDWEIVYDELYFTVSEEQDGGALLAKSTEFIAQIQPAIITAFPTKEAIRQKASYGEYRGDPMHCPICHTEMSYHVHWHECPNGHGRLLHAQKLLGFRRGKIKYATQAEIQKEVTRTRRLLCPHCGKEMLPTQYLTKELIIDSCSECPYRWLDAGELAKIIPALSKE